MTRMNMAGGLTLRGADLLAASLVVLSRVGTQVLATIDCDKVYSVTDAARMLEFCDRHGITVKQDWTLRGYVLNNNNEYVPRGLVGNGHRAGA